MADELEQRIQTALEQLRPQDDGCQSCDLECNHICEGCFLRKVICDMRREREDLQKQRDVAVRDLANYRSVVNGALLNQAIQTAET